MDGRGRIEKEETGRKKRIFEKIFFFRTEIKNVRFLAGFRRKRRRRRRKRNKGRKREKNKDFMQI